MRIIAIANQKGGVAKSTTAVGLSVAYACRGERTLLIDMDPQATATQMAGHEPALDGDDTLSPLLSPNGAVLTLDDVEPVRDILPCLDLIRSGIPLADAERQLLGRLDPLYALRGAIEESTRGASYQRIIIDCPPSLGMLTMNALVAAEGLLIPTQTDKYSVHGVHLLLSQTVPQLRRHVNRRLRPLGIFMAIHTPNTIDGRENAGYLRATYSDLLLDTFIKHSTRVRNATKRGIDSTPPEMRAAYAALAHELDQRETE